MIFLRLTPNLQDSSSAVFERVRLLFFRETPLHICGRDNLDRVPADFLLSFPRPATFFSMHLVSLSVGFFFGKTVRTLATNRISFFHLLFVALSVHGHHRKEKHTQYKLNQKLGRNLFSSIPHEGGHEPLAKDGSEYQIVSQYFHQIFFHGRDFQLLGKEHVFI